MAVLRLVPALLSSALLFALPARAAAEADTKLDMKWDAPAGCPAYADVESWLQAVIPPDAREGLAELHVSVTITGSPSMGFTANVRVTRDGIAADTSAEPRSVQGPSCEEVARSAIVVVSVDMSDAMKAELVQPGTAPEPTPETPAPTPAASPLRIEAPPPLPADVGALPVSPKDELLLTASVGAGSGFASRPGVRFDASLLLAFGHALLGGLRVHGLPSVTIRRQQDVADLHFIAAGPELCALPSWGQSLRAGACARVELGWAWAEGVSPSDPHDSGPVGALALSPTVAIGRRVRLVLQGDVELRLIRPRFESNTGQVLATLPTLAGSGLLGFSVSVP